MRLCTYPFYTFCNETVELYLPKVQMNKYRDTHHIVRSVYLGRKAVVWQNNGYSLFFQSGGYHEQFKNLVILSKIVMLLTRNFTSQAGQLAVIQYCHRTTISSDTILSPHHTYYSHVKC